MTKAASCRGLLARRQVARARTATVLHSRRHDKAARLAGRVLELSQLCSRHVRVIVRFHVLRGGGGGEQRCYRRCAGGSQGYILSMLLLQLVVGPPRRGPGECPALLATASRTAALLCCCQQRVAVSRDSLWLGGGIPTVATAVHYRSSFHCGAPLRKQQQT